MHEYMYSLLTILMTMVSVLTYTVQDSMLMQARYALPQEDVLMEKRETLHGKAGNVCFRSTFVDL